MRSFNIAIVGATGLVGTTLLKILEERAFPIQQIFLLASEQSAGKTLFFKGKPHVIQDLAQFDFTQTELAFFCVSNDLAQKYVPIAIACGNKVIDKSNCFRLKDEVPLIIPEVNIECLVKHKQLIANPNCNTIPITVALKPIYDAVGIERINVATYQAVSGTGKDAVEELQEQTRSLLMNQKISPKIYQQQIAFNVLPHCDDFQENGYTREEMKIVWEMQKILQDKSLLINPTAVRVPVICGHAASVHLETKEKISVAHVLQLLNQSPAIKLITGKYPYPTPVLNAAGNDFVFVGRVREDISHKRGLNLWVVADNLRKGAALNAVQIAEHLINNQMLT